MPTAGALRRPIWTVSGLRRISAASLAITGGIVAENSSVCRAGRQPGDDPLDVRQEAHVEHAVGLVEDEGVDLVEARLVLPHVVEEPARRGDEQFDAGPQRLLLRSHRRAAHDDADPQRRVVRQAQQHVVDLLGQLARRREDQRLGHAVRHAEEPVQDRQQEGGGLAGAGLGGGDQVAAGQDGRDGLGLDRRRLGVAHVARRLHRAGMQAQGLERHRELPRAAGRAQKSFIVFAWFKEEDASICVRVARVGKRCYTAGDCGC